MKATPIIAAACLVCSIVAQTVGQPVDPPPIAPPLRADRNRPGPWDNDVLVYRVATNGIAEKLTQFDRAGVPTLARLRDGRIMAAFQHFPQNDNRNFDRVAVRFSTEEGRTWTQAEPIGVDGLEAGLARPFDPTLVPLPDGRIRLYFTSNRSPDFQRSTPAIYSAVSSNGIQYTFEPGVRFGLKDRIVIDCGAALHQGVFHLIVPDNGTGAEFAERPARGQPPRGGTGYHAVSKDGLKFERVQDVRLPTNGRWLGNMQSDGGRLVFFGTGDRGIWSATSSDGQNWELSDRPAKVPGADPGAVKLPDGSWLLAVTGPPRSETRSAADRLPSAVPRRVFTRVPSSAGGEEGIAVGVLMPDRPRYTNGAPIVINVTGGVQPGSAAGPPEYVRHGFVEVHFAFPGGGEGPEHSGGRYDFRGSNSVQALADVIRFATGHALDEQGRTMAELGAGVQMLPNDCGLIGSSHGGNACGVAMARYGGAFPELAWYASMESPYGEGAANVELGGRDTGLNPAYDSRTGRLDLSRLAWDPELTPGLVGRAMLVETRGIRGALFFDLDSDGHFDRENDFPANCFVGDAGDGLRAWYSPRLLAEAERRELIPAQRPDHIPTLPEAREFWRWRDAAPSIPPVVSQFPKLGVIVYANRQDHVQADPAHTHILAQVEGFRRAGARFVRLNPDRAYVEWVVAKLPREFREAEFADNPAGKPWTRSNLREGLEPANVPLGLYMQAAACELADRAQAGIWEPDLDTVLFPAAPRPTPLAAGPRRPQR